MGIDYFQPRKLPSSPLVQNPRLSKNQPDLDKNIEIMATAAAAEKVLDAPQGQTSARRLSSLPEERVP